MRARRWIIALAAALSMTSPAFAQAPQTTAQRVNDAVSYGEVGTNVLMTVIATLKSPNPGCAAKQNAFAAGFAVGVSEALKAAITKARPDASDYKSFPSEHSALAAAASGWNFYLGGTIALGTASSRVAANRHDKADVAAGLLIGYGGRQLAKLFFRCDPRAA